MDRETGRETFLSREGGRLARALAQLQSGGGWAEGFFERLELVELAPDQEPGVRVVREQGFALRHQHGDRSWAASRDELDERRLAAAFRQVARMAPPTAPVFTGIAFPPWEEELAISDLLDFPLALQRALRERRVGFPLELRVRRHSRLVAVVGPHLQPEPESERFFSVEIGLRNAIPRSGRGAGRGGASSLGVLLPVLEHAADGVAHLLVERFRARDAPAPESGARVVVLGPAAAAVFLHEAVGHTLEADTLALSGEPSAAIGRRLGSTILDLIDDPGGAPAAVRRRTDDEGMPALRRWLLRQGAVEQPLADRVWAERDGLLLAGSGRRSGRHQHPSPRCYHLELLPGVATDQELLAEADDGLYIEEASRGQLDALSGRFFIEAPWSRRIEGGALAERRGACRIEGHVDDLLGRLIAVGNAPVPVGAGWCAKGGQRLPVWATSAAVRLEGVLVGPAA